MITHEQCLNKMKRIKELTDVKEELKNESSKITLMLDELNNEVSEYMELTDQTQIRIKNLGLFFLQTDSKPQFEDKEVCIKWLEERGELDTFMMFNTRGFYAYWKELNEKGDDLPPGVKTYIKKEVKLRRD